MPMKKLRISLIIILAIACLSFASYYKFGSINFPKVVQAIALVNTNSKDYVVVQDGTKKVIIAKGDGSYSFIKYINSVGYNVVDQLGSIYTIEKDGIKKDVYVSVHSYCSLWRWI